MLTKQNCIGDSLKIKRRKEEFKGKLVLRMVLEPMMSALQKCTKLRLSVVASSDV